MPTNPSKEIGNKGPCFKCGKEIYCNANTYNKETKPQWQNSDNKAHYDREGNCKGDNNQSSSSPAPIVSQKVKLEDIKLEEDILDNVLHVAKSGTQFLKALEFAVWEELGNTSPAHVGLYVKILADKMLNIPNLDKILKEVKVT